METTHITSSLEQEEAVDLTLKERRYQDKKWGGPRLDDSNKPKEWERFVLDYLNGPRGADYSFAKRMLKVTALGLAALEAELRAGRRPE